MLAFHPADMRIRGGAQASVRHQSTINHYAAAHDTKVVRIFRERGVSGEKELKDRPAFMEMLTALHANGVRKSGSERESGEATD